MRCLLLFVLVTLSSIIVNIDAAYYPPVISKDGMVVSDQYLASDVGEEILKQGGNAMDAAVAVGYALAVVDPCCGNIGGGGFMTVHWHDGQNIVLDFREVAPKAVNADSYYQADGHMKSHHSLGYLLVGVPGTVMGLNTALKKFGTMSLAQVMNPAIALAKKGFVLNRFDVASIERSKKKFVGRRNVIKLFKPKKHWLKSGDRFIQADLAHTLTLIRDQGDAVFYQGEIAKAVVHASTLHGGILSLDDFKNYAIKWRAPVLCGYRNLTIITSPPPSSGAIVCEILKTLDRFDLKKSGYHSAKSIYYNVAAMRQSFHDRNLYFGDPDFVKNPTTWLLSDKHIKKLQEAIINQDKLNTPPQEGADTSMHTTHFVVMDKAHNVVSTTYTINSPFGAGLIAGKTGFFLNNELDDFTLRVGHKNQFRLVQGKLNLIAAGKRPLSSMSPSIVLEKGDIFMALGAAGGPTIITTIVEAIENVVDYNMNIRAAIDSPRYHMQWKPNIVYMEPFAITVDSVRLLEKMGFHLQHKLFDRFEYWGQANALLVDSQGIIAGSSDNRRPNGRAAGVGVVEQFRTNAMY